MRLAGYLDGFVPPVDSSVLVHANDWLADERFWPAFLHAFGGSRTAVDVFDVDPADVGEMIEQLVALGRAFSPETA